MSEVMARKLSERKMTILEQAARIRTLELALKEARGAWTRVTEWTNLDFLRGANPEHPLVLMDKALKGAGRDRPK